MFTGGQHHAHHRLLGGFRHAQIDEAGSGDIGRGDQVAASGMRQHGIHDCLRQFARIFLQRLGQLHGDVAGNIAMRRIARTLQRNRRFQFGSGDQRRQGILE